MRFVNAPVTFLGSLGDDSFLLTSEGRRAFAAAFGFPFAAFLLLIANAAWLASFDSSIAWSILVFQIFILNCVALVCFRNWSITGTLGKVE